MKTKAQAQAVKTTDISLPTIAFVAALGFTALFAAGFANSAVMHDTAHDIRHAAGFPCH